MATGEAVPANQEYEDKPRQIASWGNLAGYLAIIAGITLWGFHTQKVGLGSAPSGQIVEHSQAIKNYLITILADWALLTTAGSVSIGMAAI
ncbi:MAG TPA: hypothetical protein VJW20_01600 [Candidatus Angelobacter sp.]|nr:hypothetical protein [Candidatus Angelobacter sp.]